VQIGSGKVIRFLWWKIKLYSRVYREIFDI